MTQTLVLDKRYKGVGRIKKATGTNDEKEFEQICSVFKTLEMMRGGQEVLRGVRDGFIHPKQVVSEFLSGNIERLIRVEDFTDLFTAVEDWAEYEFDGAETTAREYRGSVRRVLDGKRKKVSEIPVLLRAYRRKCKAAGTPVGFNRAKSGFQAFLRDMYGRRYWVYQEVRDIQSLKSVRKEKPRISVEFADEVRRCLGPNGDMWWSMCVTGMNPKEYFEDGWETLADRIVVRGVKRTGRHRQIPLFITPVPPRLTQEGFKSAIQRLGKGVTPKSARDAYAQWLVDAGIPKVRREIYLGHGTRDVQDLYERHEIDSYLADDGHMLVSLIGRLFTDVRPLIVPK